MNRQAGRHSCSVELREHGKSKDGSGHGEVMYQYVDSIPVRVMNGMQNMYLQS